MFGWNLSLLQTAIGNLHAQAREIVLTPAPGKEWDIAVEFQRGPSLNGVLTTEKESLHAFAQQVVDRTE